MKNNKLIFSVIIVFFIFSTINLFTTLGAEKSITINGIEIEDKSDDTVVNSCGFEKNTINTDVVFYNVGDFIKYKITIKNNDSVNYTIKSITGSDSEFVTYEFDYSQDKIASKDKGCFYITAKYSQEVTDINDRIQSEDVEIELVLEDEEGNEKEENINITNNNTSSNNTASQNSVIGTNEPINGQDNNVNNVDGHETQQDSSKNTDGQKIEQNISQTNIDENTINQENDESNKITNKNPITGDNISFYLILEILSGVLLIVNFVTVKKSNNSKLSKIKKRVKNIKMFGFIVIALLLTPTIVKATYNKIVITNKATFYFYDKLIVTYDINGELKQKIVKYNTELEMPEDAVLDGYNFEGWYTEPEGGEKITGETQITEDTVFYARFSIINYNITYNLNGGEATNPTTYTVEDEIQLNNPTKEGYTFSGWTGSNGEGLQTGVTINKGSTGDKEFVANYSANQNTKYKVIHKKMNMDGQTYSESDVDELEGATDTTVTPEVKDYEGFKAPDLQDLVITGDGKAELVYEYTRNKYTLTLEDTDYVDLENSTSAGNYYYGTEINLIAKNREGYIWSGWSTQKIEQDLKFILKNNTTIKPQYIAKEYSISYDLDGGEVSIENPTKYTIETEDFTLNNPKKSKYLFIGWSGTDIEDKSITVTVPKGSIENREYTANYSLMTSEITISVENEDVYMGAKDVTISTNLTNITDAEVKTQYSLDDGATWNDYNDTITVTDNGTIKARTVVLEDDAIIGESSKEITKVCDPVVDIEILNSELDQDKITKTVTINYNVQYLEEEKYTNQYSTDGGSNWITYSESFEISTTTTVKARCILNYNNDVINSTEKEVTISKAYFKEFDGSTTLFGITGINKSSVTYIGKTTENLTAEIINTRINNGDTIYEINNNVNDDYFSDYKIYGWLDNGKFYWWSSADIVYFHPNTIKGFYDFYNAETIDLTGINTSLVKDFSSWFDQAAHYGSTKFANLIGQIDTRNATSAYRMFYNCQVLKSIDTSKFNTSKIENMQNMFGATKKLEGIDVSMFDTSNVKDMHRMFNKMGMNNNTAIPSLDLSSFDTSKVTDMSYMFAEAKVSEIILGDGFTTSNVTTLESMFHNTKSTSRVYVSISFDLTKVTKTSNIFNTFNSIVGGKGTVYNANAKNDATYARIDEGTSNPGYFTDINEKQ